MKPKEKQFTNFKNNKDNFVITSDKPNKGEITKIDPLKQRIDTHLTIKKLGRTIYLLADYILRMNMYIKSGNMWQKKIADEDWIGLQEFMNGKKGVIYDNVYKVIELGELLMCLEKKGKCEYAQGCWITRKGFAKCMEKYK